MKYTHIFFDLGLTLIVRDRAGRYQQILLDHGIIRNRDELEKAFHLADKTFFREYPGILGKSCELYLPWYYGIVNFYLEISLDLIKLSQELSSCSQKLEWKPFSFTLPTLKKLSDHGIKLGLISNWDSTCRDVLRRTKVERYLEYIVVSSEVGIEKPNPDIFKRALSIAQVPANECLYIGDNYYDDVKGSRAVGMDCYLINPDTEFGIEEIRYHNIIQNIEKLPDMLNI